MKASLPLFLIAALALAAPLAGAGERVLAELSPQTQGRATSALFSKVTENDGTYYRLGSDSAPIHENILKIEKPAITTDFYAVRGEVRYHDLKGDGMLEMWSAFPGGGHYFSRTLADAGPLAKLTGSSEWRPFALPFNAQGASGHPESLTVNVHLPAPGYVELRALQLVQGNSFGEVFAAPGDWWSGATAGWIGGIGGGLLGCLGTLLEWCASRGKARAFVLQTSRILIALGVVVLAFSLVAICLRQPYAVWYAALLGGILCAGIFPFRLRRYQARYRELELRRMAALDATP